MRRARVFCPTPLPRKGHRLRLRLRPCHYHYHYHIPYHREHATLLVLLPVVAAPQAAIVCLKALILSTMKPHNLAAVTVCYPWPLCPQPLPFITRRCDDLLRIPGFPGYPWVPRTIAMIPPLLLWRTQHGSCRSSRRNRIETLFNKLMLFVNCAKGASRAQLSYVAWDRETGGTASNAIKTGLVQRSSTWLCQYFICLLLLKVVGLIQHVFQIKTLS